MRLSIEVPFSGRLDWRALRDHPVFLYRRVADRSQAFLGVGVKAAFEHREGGRGVDGFLGLRNFLQQQGDWAFGHLAYDLKNEVEDLASRHSDRIGWPLAQWFVPRFVVGFGSGSAVLHVHPEDRAEGEQLLKGLLVNPGSPAPMSPGSWSLMTARATYLERARLILEHFQRGDAYELNYCTERVLDGSGFDPFAAFALLHERLNAPHSTFYRMGDRFAVGGSPERFLRFEGDRVIAQPMKGTRPRSTDPAMDRALAEELAADPKERGENIMAVDVMRNDLSRVARSRSVRVDELCAVRSYPAVHQMVSTVTAELAEGLHPVDAIRATWPMASMTGAPKVSAMRLIDAAEDMRRGLFSGSLGFFTPDGVADLNVVIRTVQYDAATDHASLITGGALTAACDPEQEWEECQLKARSVLNAIGHAG